MLKAKKKIEEIPAVDAKHGPTGATARRQELLREQQARRDAAEIEGDGIAPEPARVPIDLGAIFHRLDAHLRNNCNTALLAVLMPQSDSLRPAEFWIFEAGLVHGGSVREIDLVQRANELGILEACESPLSHWASFPPH
jgi:hypothetical protein